jgi:hypothetical protein
VLDRLYPSVVAGDTLAFAYEDLARSGYGGAGRQQAWLTPPSSMPALSALVSGRQYGVLVWRGSAARLHLPRSFAPTVVSDVAIVSGVPSTGPVRVIPEAGSTVARSLAVDAGTGVHAALVVNGSASPAALTAAQAELRSWLAQRFP